MAYTFFIKMKNLAPRNNSLAGPILSIALLTPVYSQQPVPWRDPSPHATQFVTVDKSVRLEVLDWGGTGRPVILLAGGGNTAHVFDEFAPKLTANYRVYGITRRGFGASSYAPLHDGADRLGKDILSVIRALKLNKPVLVGHSIAGVELSSVANLAPASIAGVVYLEAAYPYAFDNGQGPSMKAFQELAAPQAPSPAESALKSFRALQKWDAQIYGFRLPESEFHQTWDLKGPRDFPGSQYLMTILTDIKRYANIPVPALAVFAIPHVPDAWMTASTDPGVRQAAEAYFTKLDILAETQAKAVESAIPSARVVRRRAMHYIFVSNRADVLREMRSFLASLK